MHKKLKVLYKPFRPAMANKRHTVEQVVDFITAPDDESELADIDFRDIENDLGSKDGDVEEPDYLTADGSTELTPNEFLTMRRSEARTRRTSGEDKENIRGKDEENIRGKDEENVGGEDNIGGKDEENVGGEDNIGGKDEENVGSEGEENIGGKDKESIGFEDKENIGVEDGIMTMIPSYISSPPYNKQAGLMQAAKCNDTPLEFFKVLFPDELVYVVLLKRICMPLRMASMSRLLRRTP